MEFQLAPTLQAARAADPEELPSSSSSSMDTDAAEDAPVLDNETQWLLYSNAGFIQVGGRGCWAWALALLLALAQLLGQPACCAPRRSPWRRLTGPRLWLAPPQAQLQQLISQGLNLQEFMFHVLKSCYIVLMNARQALAGHCWRCLGPSSGRSQHAAGLLLRPACSGQQAHEPMS